MSRFPHPSPLSLLVPALLALAPAAPSPAAEKDPIVARQEAMETIGASMKALASIARKEAPFDPAEVRKRSETIASRLEAAAALFPEGSDRGGEETWAKGEIWANRPDFESLLKSAHAAAADLAGVGDEAGYGPALGRLGNACKGCHEKYRRPKD